MTPTEDLVDEHKAIKLGLRILEAISGKLDAGEEVEAQDLGQMVEFIKVFADKCHHGKEEDLLFPAMEQVGVAREGGPIGVMLSQHAMGRAYVRAMGEAVAKYAAGDRSAASAIAENARAYVALLSGHIDKEDNILYPMADARLSPQAQQELTQGFARVEREVVGPGKHEEFHELLHRLEHAYLQ